MNRLAKTALCQLLVVLMAWMPFQAKAGMIGTERAAGADDARSAIVAVLDRADVASGLKTLGVSRSAALERVNAMSDAEVAVLARDLQSAPAGGLSGFGLAILLIIAIFAVNWWAAEVGMKQPK